MLNEFSIKKFSLLFYELFNCSSVNKYNFYYLKSNTGLIFKNNQFSVKTEYEIHYRENFSSKYQASFILQKKLVKDFNIRYYFIKKQGESNQNHVGLNYFW